MLNSKLKKTAISIFVISVVNYKRIAEKTQMFSSELIIETQGSVH